MKILITTDWYAPTINGVVTSVLNLQRGLTALGHEVRVLTLSQSPRSYCNGPVTYIGAVSAGKIYPGARLRTALARGLVQDLIDWKPDIIHSQCEFSTFLAAQKISAATNAPIVHTYHTVYEDYTHYFSPSRKWGRRAVALFTRKVVSHTAAVIAPTDKVRSILERYHISRPIFVVPTGIDLRQYRRVPDAGRQSALRQKLGIPEGQFILLYVGRLAAEKNVEELIHHVSSLSYQNITLLLVGDGPYRRTLEALAHSLGLEQNIIFTGMVKPDEIADYYHLGNLFVSASSSETQGLTYLEALASGLPALCRRDPCLSGVIQNGVNGWQYTDGSEFRRHVSELLSSPSLQTELSQNASIDAQREFSSEVFAERAAAVYEQVLSFTRRSKVA